MRRRVGVPAVAGLGVGAMAFLVLLEVRGYPWLLASLAGLAIGLLPFIAWRTIEQIRAVIADLAPPSDIDDRDR